MTIATEPTVSLIINPRNGEWSVHVWFPDTKRRFRRGLRTADKAEAQAKLDEWRMYALPKLIDENKAAEPATSKAGLRIRDWADWFINKHLPDRQVAPRTIQKYDQVMRDFELWARANHIGRLSQLNYARIAEFVDALSLQPGRAKHAAKTRAGFKAIIRVAINAAVDAGMIDQTPIKKWFIKNPPSTRQTFALTFAETRAMLDAIASHAPHIHPIIAFMTATGQRPSDAMDLRWSQVDLGRRITRRTQVKTKLVATYSLCDLACKAILSQQHSQIRPGLGHVFVNTADAPFAYNALYRAFTRALDRAGIEIKRDGQKMRIDLKTLRHSYASNMANAGCPPPLLQRQMGHTRIETTMVYYHFDEEMGLFWADKMDEKLQLPKQTRGATISTPSKSPT